MPSLHVQCAKIELVATWNWYLLNSVELKRQMLFTVGNRQCLDCITFK